MSTSAQKRLQRVSEVFVLPEIIVQLGGNPQHAVGMSRPRNYGYFDTKVLEELLLDRIDVQW